MVTVIRNSLLLLGAMVFAVVLLQDNLGLLTAAIQNLRTDQAASSGRATPPPPSPADVSDSANGGRLVIEGGTWGHFHLNAEIGGREISFLVDTGASMVALSQDDAETIGFPIQQLEYSGRANTANGTARFARVTIDEITIGDNVVKNVPAVVMEAPMESSLLGMSFLSKLAGFEVKDNRLILRW